jgi:hypothetical protein
MTSPDQAVTAPTLAGRRILLAAAMAAIEAYEDEALPNRNIQPAIRWLAYGRREAMLSRQALQNRTRGSL